MYKQTVIILIFLIAFLVPASADGMMHSEVMPGIWQPLAESQQMAAINYQDGFQDMIVTIDLNDLQGEQAVWIFPVPAKPDKTIINVLDEFPRFSGESIEASAKRAVGGVFTGIAMTQPYAFPFAFLMTGFSAGASMGLDMAESNMVGKIKDQGITVHESIEKLGMTTELISAETGTYFINYIRFKGLELPFKSKDLLDEYVGNDYSFVISWISNITEFNQNNVNPGFPYGNSRTIGVSLTFPTDRMYFPLKPTSIYGSEEIPIRVYVVGHVMPEMYPEISRTSTISYHKSNYYGIPVGLKSFFGGQTSISDFRYTQINILAPSKYFSEDLWIDNEPPAKVAVLEFISSQPWVWGIITLAILSMLASIVAGLVVFRDQKPDIKQFALFGLFNLFTLIGLAIASYRFMDNKKAKKEDSWDSVKKILMTVGAITGVFALVFLVQPLLRSYAYPSSYVVNNFVSSIVLVFGFVLVIVAPFLWGHFRNKEVRNYLLLFTGVFIFLTWVAFNLVMSII